MKSCKCRVRGRVQGVWYRKYTKEVADRLGISGEVQNMDDGSVEVRATMDEEAFGPFIEALKKGPPLARVDAVEIEESGEVYTGGFRIVR